MKEFFMFDSLCLFAFGLILLIKGGDMFVDGASKIAKRFRLPELLIGATVVSIGTTLPEVMVSSVAAVGGSGGIAYGNALGSIICNTAIIAAVTIAVKPGKAERKTMILPVAFFFGAFAFYSVVAYAMGGFPLWSGVVLLAIFVLYMTVTALQMKRQAKETVHEELPEIEEEEKGSVISEIFMLVAGAALIALGAVLVKDNAEYIATEIGIPASVIGITVVAIGTSLPELVTAITALMKGHGALSLGNIIGANLFNLVLVSGMAVTIAPFDLPSVMTIGGINSSLVIDIPTAFAVMLILTVPVLLKQKLSRWQGISLLLIYAAFSASQFVLAMV